MESLTRDNYETWFLDFLDGQLSNEQLETLLDFLELNPDLKQELQGISGVSLTAGSESVGQKDFLLKGPADIPGMAATDQLCIARMENDLTAEEAGRFDARLDEDAALSENYEAFLATRLNPADRVVFPYKNDLLKKTRVLTPWIITAISSAAVIMLAWFLWPDQQEKAIPSMAKTESPAPDTRQTESITPQIRNEVHQTAPAGDLLASGSLDQVSPARRKASASPAALDGEKPARSDREFVPMNKISRNPAVSGPRIPDPRTTRLLYASNFPAANDIRLNAPDALTVPQFALQLFREKILGEDRKWSGKPVLPSGRLPVPESTKSTTWPVQK
jgi:hypothetical protein